MKSPSGQQSARRGLLSALLVFALLHAPALAQQPAQTTTPPAQAGAPKPAAAATLSAAEREAVSRVKLETVREVTTALASNEFEGRGTAQAGADRAARYLADRFGKLGLKPLGTNGTYLQPIKFRTSQVLPATSLKIGDADFKHGVDFIHPPPHTSETADATGELVFVGYGVVSEELKRDDFAGLDLKGKIAVYLNGKPQGVDAAAWQKAANPQARVGNVFGRGAIGLIVAGAGSPQQPFEVIANYLSRRRVSLASDPVPPMKFPPVLLLSDAAMEKAFAGTGTTYAETRTKLLAGETASKSLGKTASIGLRVKLGEAESSNVVALLEGSDAKLKEEAVVYTAHYDAYGVDAAGTIFPGAADNALGTAMVMSIAEAVARATPRPRRSMIFLLVTGEEYGLLGARYWVNNPTWPLARVAANINHDSAGTEVYAPVGRVVGWGQEHSELGKVFESVVEATGNTVTPDPLPEENVFVRSDHYEFVKKGVPALMLLGGPAGDLSAWLPRTQKWLVTDYHSPNDRVMPDWDWTGPQEVAQIGLVIGLRVANADTAPSYHTTSPFYKPRAATTPAPTR